MDMPCNIGLPAQDMKMIGIHVTLDWVQDNMKLAVDFFPFFEMGAKMLDRKCLQPVLCLLTDDYGQAQFVQNSSRLERSDFFPGVGWRLTNALWQSLK